MLVRSTLRYCSRTIARSNKIALHVTSARITAVSKLLPCTEPQNKIEHGSTSKSKSAGKIRDVQRLTSLFILDVLLRGRDDQMLISVEQLGEQPTRDLTHHLIVVQLGHTLSALL